MKRNTVFKNYLYSLSYQLISVLLPLITMPFIVRRLSDVGMGIFDFQQSVSSYFIIFGYIGLNIYGQREIAFCNDNETKRTKIFWEIMILKFVTLSVSILFFLVFIVRGSEHPYMFFLFTFEIFACVFDVTWFYQGVENFKYVMVRDFLIKLIVNVAALIFVRNEEHLWLYTALYPIASVISNLWIWPRLSRYLTKYRGKLNPFSHVKKTLMIFVPQIAICIYTQLDRTMIGFMCNYNEVAYYGQSEKIIKVAAAITGSLGIVMLSRIAATYSERNSEKISEYLKNSFKFIFFLSLPITFGVMAITYKFVPWFLGEGWNDVTPCLMAMCPFVFLSSVTNTIGTQYLIPTKRIKAYSLSVTAGLFTSILLNLFTIPRWGSSGAAASLVTAEFTVAAIQFFFTRKEIGFKMLLWAIKPFIASLVMGATVFFISLSIAPSLINTVLQILIGIVIYLALLFILHDNYLFEIFEYIRAKFIRKK